VIEGQPAAHAVSCCVVDVGSRPTEGADLAPPGSRCGVGSSLASPTLVVGIWQEASCPVADCGCGPTGGGGESAMVLGER